MRTKDPKSLLDRYLSKTASAKKGSKKTKRKRTILEVYSDYYYKSKLQGLVNEELKGIPQYASLPQKMKHSQRMSVYLRIRGDCWKNESDEVKAEIQKIFDEKNRVKAETDEEDEDEIDSETEDNDNDNNDDDDDEKTLLQRQQE